MAHRDHEPGPRMHVIKMHGQLSTALTSYPRVIRTFFTVPRFV